MSKTRAKIVGCILEHDGKILLLLRHSHKPDGDTWALPGGKADPGETDKQAIVRELYEETGYRATESELEYLGAFPFTSPRNEDYIYATFSVKLDGPHAVALEESAHADFKWVTVEQADARDDLIYGLHDLFRLIGYIKEGK